MKIKRCLLGILPCALILSVIFFIFTFNSPKKAEAATAEQITQSFESGVPDNWSTGSGELSITGKRFKLGEKSLLWRVGASDTVTVTDEINMTSLAGRKIRSGGFVMWIYSEEACAGEALDFRLGDRNHAENGLSFSFTFNNRG